MCYKTWLCLLVCIGTSTTYGFKCVRLGNFTVKKEHCAYAVVQKKRLIRIVRVVNKVLLT
jgi:hypothetical protein